jgi:hypothetical protein
MRLPATGIKIYVLCHSRESGNPGPGHILDSRLVISRMTVGLRSDKLAAYIKTYMSFLRKQESMRACHNGCQIDSGMTDIPSSYARYATSASFLMRHDGYPIFVG